MNSRYLSIIMIMVLLLFSLSDAVSQETTAAHFVAPITICLPTCTTKISRLFLQKDLSSAPINNGMGWTSFSNLSAPDLGPNGDIVRFVRGEKQPPPIYDTCVTVNSGAGIALQTLKDVFVSTTLFKNDKVFNDNGTVRSWRVLCPVLDRSCDRPCANPPNCACPPGGQGTINERFHVAKCANVLITDVITEEAEEGIVIEGMECLDCDNYYAKGEVTPISHDFGSINVDNSSTPVTFTISNTGTLDLMIDSIILTDTITGLSSKEFTKQNDNCTGRLIVPLSNCTFQAMFLPTSAGSKSAILSISSNSRNSPHNISLTGVGIIPIYSLSVGNISGIGSISAMGIDCPPDCSETYHSGTNLDLKATPGEGWYFDSWGGDILGNMNPYTLLINSDKNITVTFSKLDTDGNGANEVNRHKDDLGTLVYNLIVGDGDYPVTVGSVSVSDDNTNLVVTYTIDTGDWKISKTHLHVVTSVEGFPKGKNGCLDPDRFTYSFPSMSPYTAQTYTIPVSSIFGYSPAPGGPYTIYIAAEATVRKNSDRESMQTAWGQDRTFPCKKWASYISYPLNISP
jgi:Divergent InlB B-repeat domain